jgi:hypothetical protein
MDQSVGFIFSIGNLYTDLMWNVTMHTNSYWPRETARPQVDDWSSNVGLVADCDSLSHPTLNKGTVRWGPHILNCSTCSYQDPPPQPQSAVTLHQMSPLDHLQTTESSPFTFTACVHLYCYIYSLEFCPVPPFWPSAWLTPSHHTRPTTWASYYEYHISELW